MTTKKLMTAAIAVAALATASIAISGDAYARGGHGGGHGGGFRGGFHGGAKFFHGGRHFGHRWHGHRWGRLAGTVRLQHLLEVHALRPRERVPRAALLRRPRKCSPMARPGEMARAGLCLRVIQSAAAAGFPPPRHALSLAPSARMAATLDEHGKAGPRSRQSSLRIAAGIVGGAVRDRAAASSQGGPDPFYRRRAGRRLLSGRAGPVEGDCRVALGRRAHSGDPWPRRPGRRARHGGRAAAFGLGDGGARFGTELHQPRLV